ncbi:ComF family protein [Paenibacillus radicis (ex Gao et al. 2016)]|uniref:ComF family protein n=1 Tax=Paenibacillus radicis (ex Gao et al. 2016) TaxID=1737354 RepID=UPI001665A8A0|nr:ComF family protein [Paenibacillus radicis (ex Gao et al. 2016)]
MKWLIQFLQRSYSGIDRSIQWLGPSPVSCTFCGQTIRGGGNSTSRAGLPSELPKSFISSVCHSCLYNIPWLLRPKCWICGRGVVCGDCARRTNAYFVANRSAVQYTSEMREWLAQYKYRGNEQMEPLLTEMMVPAYRAVTKLAAARIALRNPALNNPPKGGAVSVSEVHWDAITYVPVSSERAEERGFNQAERFAERISRQFQIPLINLLYRDRHTEKQSFQSRSERMRNTQRLFRALPEGLAHLSQLAAKPSAGKRTASLESGYISETSQRRQKRQILLIDDIYTTGSTIQSCSEALHLQSPLPLDIYALTWARS